MVPNEKNQKSRKACERNILGWEDFLKGKFEDRFNSMSR